MTLSPDGKTILLEYMDAIVLWDIVQKNTLNVWADYVNVGYFPQVGLSPDGKNVVSVSKDSIKSWNVETQQMQFLTYGDGYQVDGFAISPDSRKIAVGKTHRVELIDIQTGKVETQFPHSIGHAENIAYSATGRWIAAANWYRKLAILDVKNPENIQRFPPKIDNETPTIFALSFSDDDKYLVASGEIRTSNNKTKNSIQLWKREIDTFVYQYAWETAFWQSPAFTTDADGSTLIAAHKNDNIHIWKLTEDKPILLNTVEGGSPLKFTPDGHYLITDGIIWDRQTNMPIYHPTIPHFSDINKDGTVLLSYKTQGQFEVWDISHQLSLLPKTIDAKGKMLVQLGDVKRNQLLQNFPNPFNPETWIPFQIAEKSDVKIRIYTQTGKLVRTLSLGVLAAGEYTTQTKAAHWDGRNDIGEPVSSGIYIYTITAGDFTATRKMLIRK